MNLRTLARGAVLPLAFAAKAAHAGRAEPIQSHRRRSQPRLSLPRPPDRATGPGGGSAGGGLDPREQVHLPILDHDAPSLAQERWFVAHFMPDY
jgi:hypothetical protein